MRNSEIILNTQCGIDSSNILSSAAWTNLCGGRQHALECRCHEECWWWKEPVDIPWMRKYAIVWFECPPKPTCHDDEGLGCKISALNRKILSEIDKTDEFRRRSIILHYFLDLHSVKHNTTIFVLPSIRSVHKSAKNCKTWLLKPGRPSIPFN